MYDQKKVWLIKKKREADAVDIRTLVQPSFEKPLNPFELAASLGIDAITPYEIDNTDQNCISNLCNHYSREWDAFTLAAFEICKIIIVYNPEKAPKRINATIMEEISHILLGHEPTQIAEQNGAFFRDYNSAQEEEAKYVGWAALLPRESLKWAISKKLTLEEISDHFGASQKMIEYRLNRTNLKKAHVRCLN